MIFFTADPHFYHDKVIKHVNRPFRTVQQMNQVLMENWNRKISSTDDIYILGDFTLKGPQLAMEILQQLKGRKHLILGNHDQFVEKNDFDQSLFCSIQHYKEIRFENTYFILSHYPMLEWNGFYKGSISLHGHQHNNNDYNYRNLQHKIRRYDVGVDANQMTPVSAEEIIQFFMMMD